VNLGTLIEGKGVTPSIPIGLSLDQLIAGEHTQMQKLLEPVSKM
jgi:hypothetical protein